MDNRNDEIKALKIEQENSFIDINFVEEIAAKVTDNLVEWANETIFKPIGGCLTLKIETFGEPNARAITYWKKPNNPTIEIRLSMFQEIYRDAFTFPLISKRIEKETNIINQFHEAFMSPYDERYMFSTGVPEIPLESRQGVLNIYCQAMLEVFSKNPNENINANDIACRFVMFEIVVAWVFFHELGHLVQRHYMLKSNSENRLETEIVEIDESGDNLDSDTAAQAREIMADIEGVNLTLQYMKRKGILQPQSMYLLLCGVNCMYQRFYQGYKTNLDITKGNHPHPVIRNEFFNDYFLQWMVVFLDNNKEQAAIPLTYLSVRSSLMSGLFWANRIESFNGEGLPTYMDLSSENYQSQKKDYMQAISDELVKMLSIIKDIHIMPSNCIALFEKSLTISSNSRVRGTGS
ncbi:hypothetical protein [Methylophaga sp.]|uniref:hypothetical protein n=1 Tax=Methylophaga sp. TaxID=2024840 RepID=UPI003A957F7D